MINKNILDNTPDGATHWDFNEYMRWDSSDEWWECYNESTKKWTHTWGVEGDIRSLVDIKRIEELENALITLLEATSDLEEDDPYVAVAEGNARRVLEVKND